MYGPYLSSIDGEQALTPPRRHCLGKPLPYQLADTEQANPKAINLYRTQTLNTNKFLFKVFARAIKYYLVFRQAIPDFWVCYLFYTFSSAGCPNIATEAPLTCMPYPRRQRSS